MVCPITRLKSHLYGEFTESHERSRMCLDMWNSFYAFCPGYCEPRLGDQYDEGWGYIDGSRGRTSSPQLGAARRSGGSSDSKDLSTMIRNSS
jgi:hypothetical protein